jgi:hydrogenase-4 transcriptional activator
VAPLDNIVLLLGETGVGKEVIANSIHYSSPRSKGPFVKVNCGAIPESLIDSELFGHEKGAFTGASSRKRGRFERAHNGTLFLDEIGELPLAAQVRLLRVLQHHVIERVGSTEPVPIDVRIIAATHQKLDLMISENRFREDLWYRLNVFPVVIPPLRQRTVDIPKLTDYFIERKCRAIGIAPKSVLASGAMERLLAYDWPGNVRELENVIEREIILHRAGPLPFTEFLPADRKISTTTAVSVIPSRMQRLDEVMATHIQNVLRTTGGRILGPGGAAEILGLPGSTLRARMRKLNIKSERKIRRTKV